MNIVKYSIVAAAFLVGITVIRKVQKYCGEKGKRGTHKAHVTRGKQSQQK